jgi:hypothetical protein
VAELWWELADECLPLLEIFLLRKTVRYSNDQISAHILEKFLVLFRPAFFAVIIVVVELILRFIAHTQSMLPDFTGFALNHKFPSIRVVLSLRMPHELRERGMPESLTCASTHTPSYTLFLFFRLLY